YELIHHKLFQKRKHFSHFLRNKLMCLMGLSLNESEGSDVDHSILKGNRLFHLSYMLSSCILLLLTLVSIISYLSLLSSRISVILQKRWAIINRSIVCLRNICRIIE